MRRATRHALFALLASGAPLAAQQPAPPPAGPIQVGGAFPSLSVIAGHEKRTEAGIGALLPWANKLWLVSYVAHIEGTNERLGLFSIDENMKMERHPASVVGTFANRYVHDATDQAFIGPYAIDAKGNVRVISALASQRTTATMTHLADPDHKVYYLTMEGLFYEVNVQSLEATLLFDLVKELDIPTSAQVHFKAAFTGRGRVVVANNSYYEPDYNGTRAAGRLASFDGTRWTIIERNPYVEVSGKRWSSKEYGDAMFALGWDRSSVLLKVLAGDTWQTYRLPKGAQTFDHAWNTEWFRIRDAQTERYLMDAHGIFYEMPAQVFNGHIFPIRPIATHLRMIPDFTYWRGLFVLAGDQVDKSVGQPQSGLWFGQVDDLWKWGKPAGWGGVWENSFVKANQPSDPFLMTGFDKKVLHLTQSSDASVTFRVEVDFLGDGSWVPYQSFTVPPKGYVHHEFPAGYSAHWVRIVPSRTTRATATFIYS